MARLFITPRELNFISDITKEVIKDVVGQKIYLYSISELKTVSHEVYNEAVQKVFDNPVEIDALVDSSFENDTKLDTFGIDKQYKIEAYIQHRDLVDKGVRVNIGDFFSFGDIFYEISERMFMRNIFGMPEHKDGVKLTGLKARETQFKSFLLGPTDVSRTDADAVENTFVQQRGMVENRLGPTGDVRDLVKNGVLEVPAEGPREVSPGGDKTNAGSSFYDE